MGNSPRTPSKPPPEASSARSAPSLPNKGPPLYVFPTSDLPSRVNIDEDGKWRKPPVKLEDCKLMEMTQYTCNIRNKFSKNAEVVCKPFQRMFRR
jgi:hypothetical protein